jgi:hypothetical protein
LPSASALPIQNHKNMNSPAALASSHLRAYDAIFQHPLSHNLGWHDVYAMLRQLGQVEEEPNGNFRVTRNGEVLVLRPPRTKDVAEVDDLMALRHFLQRSESAPSGAEGGGTHWLLVIDHQEAQVFRAEMHGAVAQQILPHEPDRYFRHAHHSKDFSRGEEKPDPGSFFGPVADALEADGQILVFGSGTGMSSEMDQFVAWAKLHRPEVARRIMGSLVVNERHLTVDQLLAKAREFFATKTNAEHEKSRL